MATLKAGSTVAADSPLRAIGAQRQIDALALKGRGGAGGAGPWKGLIAETVRRVRDQVARRKGRLYDAIRRGRGATSLRHIRQDGIANLEAVLVVCIAHADRKTGWIGDPSRKGLPWQLDELFSRAFGPSVPNELSMDRMWAWIRVLKLCGILQVLERARETPVGDRAIVAIKFLTFRFFDLIGLSSQLHLQKRMERMHATGQGTRSKNPANTLNELRTGAQKALTVGEVIERIAMPLQATREASAPTTSNAPRRDPSPDTLSTPPPIDGSPEAHIAYLKALLG